MARTNSIISVSYRNKSGNGTQTQVARGNYACWIEEHINVESIYSVFGGNVDMLARAKGTGILFEDVDLRNCSITLNNNTYEILKSARFMDYRNTVRQVQFVYG